MFWKGGGSVNISEIGVDENGFVDSGGSSRHKAITIFFFLIHVCQFQMFIDQSSYMVLLRIIILKYTFFPWNLCNGICDFLK
jgi:hypothetical protein